MDVLSSRILLRPSDLGRSRRFYRDVAPGPARLPPGHDRAVQDAVAQRHLAILLAGLRPGGEPLPGSGLTLADLRAQGPAPFVPVHPGPAQA